MWFGYSSPSDKQGQARPTGTRLGRGPQHPGAPNRDMMFLGSLPTGARGQTGVGQETSLTQDLKACQHSGFQVSAWAGLCPGGGATGRALAWATAPAVVPIGQPLSSGRAPGSRVFPGYTEPHRRLGLSQWVPHSDTQNYRHTRVTGTHRVTHSPTKPLLLDLHSHTCRLPGSSHPDPRASIPTPPSGPGVLGQPGRQARAALGRGWEAAHVAPRDGGGSEDRVGVEPTVGECM